MVIEEKKRILVPFGNPLPPKPWLAFVLAILRPPILVVGFVFSKLYKFCFARANERAAREGERRFAEEIGKHLSFLFTEYGAKFIANEDTPFPPGFDGAYATVAVGNLHLRFVRGRGDFDVSVASAFAPNYWEEFRLVADGIGEWDMVTPGPRYYDLENFESTLRSRVEQLQEALSRDRFEETLNNAVKIHNEGVDKYVARLRQSGIEPKFY
jgi:hypothetical protein